MNITCTCTPPPPLPASSQTLPCQLTGGTSCPTMICPNTAVNYTCSVGSFVAYTQWDVPSVGGCSMSPLLLAQGPPRSGLSCLNSSSSNAVCGPFTVANLPILTSNIYCLNSTLSVVITPAMNGLVVSCSSYLPISPFTTTPIGSVTISVLGKPTCIHFHVHVKLCFVGLLTLSSLQLATCKSTCTCTFIKIY